MVFLLLLMLQREALIFLVFELLFTISFRIQQKSVELVILFVMFLLNFYYVNHVIYILLARYMFIEVDELLELLLMGAVSL